MNNFKTNQTLIQITSKHINTHHGCICSSVD